MSKRVVRTRPSRDHHTLAALKREARSEPPDLEAADDVPQEAEHVVDGERKVISVAEYTRVVGNGPQQVPAHTGVECECKNRTRKGTVRVG